jgi:iron complex outermembrane recepter protein
MSNYSNLRGKCLRNLRILTLMGGSALTLVMAGQAQAQSSSQTDSEATDESSASGDILVTANRRVQSIQDVPYNINAVSGDDLGKSGVTSLNNLAQAVPGLQNIDTGPAVRGGSNNFIIRGVRADPAGAGGGTPNFRGGTVSPVSTYLGDTPIFFPLMVKDIERVEVLKGPQGTLYGSGAAAGTIRLIPKRPDFGRFSGAINVSGSISAASGKPNHAVDGVINAPLAENLALRVSGGYEHLGGFIDAVDLAARTDPSDPNSPPVSANPADPLSGYKLAPIRKDVNNSNQWFVRGALRWQASDAVDVELSYTHQYTHVDDVQISNPEYPGGILNWGVGGSGFDPLADVVAAHPGANIQLRPGGKYLSTADSLSPGTSKLDLASLSVSVDLGFATFTSSSSGYKIGTDETAYYTPSVLTYFVSPGVLGSFAADFYRAFPRFTYTNQNINKEKAFTQELRLVSNNGGPLSYVLGGYYQAQDYDFAATSRVPGLSGYSEDGVNPAYPSANPSYGDATFLSLPGESGFKFRDAALFGELSYQITPKWQVTGGGRVFWQKFTGFGRSLAVYGGAPFSGSGTDPLGETFNSTNTLKVSGKTIFKANTSYDITDDLKVYATFSQGFRRGGANQITTGGIYASLASYATFAPDKSTNYEIGIKGSAAGGQVRFDLDVYQITLDNFQFNDKTPAGFPIAFNGIKARTRGVEADLEWRPSRDLTLRVAYSYTEAKNVTAFDLEDLFVGAVFDGSIDPGDTFVAHSVPAGAKLPAVPAHTISGGIDYSIPLGGDSSIDLHADGVYRSSSDATIEPTSIYYWRIPSTFTANLRGSYNLSKALSFDVFVNNVTNETAFTGGTGPQTVSSPVSGRYVARPRTVGAALHYNF